MPMHLKHVCLFTQADSGVHYYLGHRIPLLPWQHM